MIHAVDRVYGVDRSIAATRAMPSLQRVWKHFFIREGIMSKSRPTIGVNGLALPVLPPERDARVWARMVRVMFYLPGFLALLLVKTGDAASFGVTVELLMLSSAAAIIAGLFVGTHSTGEGADISSKTGLWSGSLVLELLAAVPFLCAVPPLFHQLATSTVLHAAIKVTPDTNLGAEMLPAVAILPFMLYQLAGFGTLHYVVSKPVNWVINFAILGLIVASYVANREAAFGAERLFVSILVLSMAATIFYGILKLKRMQATYDANVPQKPEKDKAQKEKALNREEPRED
jgi:hypothetical protein